MSEYSGVTESGVDGCYAEAFIFNDNGRIQIRIEAGSVEDGIKFLRSFANNLERGRNWYDNVTKVADVGPVSIPEQVPVAEDQIRSAIRIKGDRYCYCAALQSSICHFYEEAAALKKLT